MMSHSQELEPLPNEWAQVLNRAQPFRGLYRSIISGGGAARHAQEQRLLPFFLPENLATYRKRGEAGVRIVRAQQYAPPPLMEPDRVFERYFVGFETTIQRSILDLGQLRRSFEQSYPYGLPLNRYRYVMLVMEGGVDWQISWSARTAEWWLGEGIRYILDPDHLRFTVGEALYAQYDSNDQAIKPARIASIMVFDERPFRSHTLKDIPLKYSPWANSVQQLHILSRKDGEVSGIEPRPFENFLADAEEGARMAMNWHRIEQERQSPEYQAAAAARAVDESARQLKMAQEHAREWKLFYDALIHGRLSDYYKARDAAFKAKYGFDRNRYGPDHSDQLNG
jgi:hypothetical protein